MEDEAFYNARISNYLDLTMLDNLQIIPNLSLPYNLSLMEKKAFEMAKEKANDVFTAVKFRWLEEIELFETRVKDYNKIRINAIKNIKLDNVRLSRMQNLENVIKAEDDKLKLERNIIPQLTLKQIAYIEFA